MVNKIFSLLTACALLFTLVACSSGEKSEVENTTKKVTETTTAKAQTKTTTTKKTTKEKTTKEEKIENPFAKRMTINWLVGTYTSHLYEEGRWDELELEEKFNIDLKMWNIMVDAGNMEQVKMMLAAGDVPDYGFYYTTGRFLCENGMGRTVPLDLIKQYYPSYYKLMTDDPLGLTYLKVEETEDEYYGLSMYTPLNHYTSAVDLWRLDWLENLGYNMDNLKPMASVLHPDRWNNRLYYSTTKFTIDDVKEIFRGFTEDDPDGNGVDDTFGSVDMNVAWMFGYDTKTNYFYEDPVTGDYVPYYAYTPYKEALQFSMEMNDKGYMRRNQDMQAKEIWATGKTGFMHTRGAPRVLGLGYGDGEQWPPASILNGVAPDATFVVTTAPGESGKFRAYSPFSWFTQHYTIGDISDEKLIRIFQLLEYSYFGEDWMRYKFGIEGVHYKWYDEPFKSPIVLTDPEKIPVKYAGTGTNAFGQFGNVNFISDIKAYFSFDAFLMQQIDYLEEYSPGGYFSDDLWIRPHKFYNEATMTGEQLDEFKKLRDETIDQINSVRSDFNEKVNEGQIADINTEWEMYIEQLYSNGLDKWVEFWNREEVKTYKYYKGIK